MFNHPDFEDLYAPVHISLIGVYNFIYSMSEIIGITWVDVPLNFYRPRQNPSLSHGIYYILFSLTCLTPCFYIAIKKTIKRIKDNKISKNEAILSYIYFFAEYICCIFIVCLFFPIIIPLFY